VVVSRLNPKTLPRPEDELLVVTYKYLPDGSINTELDTTPELESTIGVPESGVSAPLEAIEKIHSLEEFPLTAYMNCPGGSIAIASTPASTVVGLKSGVKAPVVAFIENAEMSPDKSFAT
jgi:hypothetical protein